MPMIIPCCATGSDVAYACFQNMKLNIWLQILEEIPSKVTTAVIEPKLLVHRLDFVHVLLIQFEVTFKIGPDP